MRLSVADLEHPDEDPQSYSIALLGGLEDDTGSILYVPLPAAQRVRGVDNAIADLPAWTLRNHLTVIAVHPWRRDELDDDALDDIASRIPGAPLYVLAHNGDGEPALAHARGEAIRGLDHAQLITELRRADVWAVLLRDGALLPASPRIHYEGPNGQHYRALLRPGFALTTSNRLDRMSFWLARALRGRTNIVVDHWSMTALAHHAVSYAARAFGTSSTEPPYIEAVPGYVAGATLAPRLRRAFPSATTDRAAFLLSINSSGSLAHDTVLPALEAAAQAGAVAIALATSSVGDDREIDALAEVGPEFSRISPDACGPCEESGMLVPVDKATYLLQLAAYTERTAITAADASVPRDVVEAYAGTGAFSIHRDYAEAGDARHHAFYVDVLAMMDTQRFAKGLMRAVGSLEDIEPSAIVCPPSDAARELARRTAELLGLPEPIVSEERGLSRLPERQLSALTEASAVLLVDDVVITGRRIEGFRQELIRLKRERALPSEVSLGCLVGVARPRDPKALQGCMDFVHHRAGKHHTFAAVETLFLPNWDQRRCPWCQELTVLTGLPPAVRDLPLTARRLNELRGHGGLSEPFFTTTTEPDDGPSAGAPTSKEEWQERSREQERSTAFEDRFWELNPGSVFGAVQGPDLVVSIAATVQTLRFKSTTDLVAKTPRLDARFRSPISKVLDPSLYLFGRFYEPVLLASLLRVCNPWDISSPDTDDELVDGMEQHLRYLSSGARLMGEAIVLGRLGRLPRMTIGAMQDPGSELDRLAQALL